MEKVSIEKTLDIIEIDDNFVELSKIDDDVFEFNVSYKVRQSVAIKNSITSVKIRTFSFQQNYSQSQVSQGTSRDSGQKILDGILNSFSNVALKKKSESSYFSSEKVSDITSRVNNSAVSQLSANVPVNEIKNFTKNQISSVLVSDARSKNKKPVTISFQNQESLKNFSSKKTSQELIQLGKDPAVLSIDNSNYTSSRESFLGIGNYSLKNNNSILSQLNRQITNELTVEKNISLEKVDLGQNYYQSLVAKSSDVINITTKIKSKLLEKDRINNLFFEFQIIGQCEKPVQTIRRSIDLKKLEKIYYTPKIKPSAFLSRSIFGSTLEVKQKDRIANSVNVWKRVYDLSSSDPFFQSYSFVGSFPVDFDQTTKINVDSSQKNPIIYRVIPSYNDVIGSVFESVVSTSGKYTHTKFSKLTTKILETGIVLEARNIPQDAVSISFVVKNTKIRSEKYYSISPVFLISEQTRSSNILTYLVSGLDTNEIYDFAILCLYKDGTSEILDNDIVEWVKPTPGLVDINVENLKINYEKNDVTFNVSLEIKDENIDQIRKILENNNLLDFYEEEIKNNRSDFKNILSCKVERTNLTTGEKEDLGILIGNKFSDFEMRKKSGAKRLLIENSYRYDIKALVRETESLIENFEKVVTVENETTSKSYMFKPYKFNNPVIYKTGTVYSSQGLKILQSKNNLELGEIGSMVSLDVEYVHTNPEIFNAKLLKFNSMTNIISWNVKDISGRIDHFLIILENKDESFVVGSCHTQGIKTNYEWIHILNPDIKGYIKYLIVPVFGDYSKGKEVKTNSLLVN